MDNPIQSVFAMAVYSVCSTRMACAATAVPKPATAGLMLFQMALPMQDIFRKLQATVVNDTYTVKAARNEFRICKRIY